MPPLRYNAKTGKFMNLEDGEEFCPKCDGFGMVPEKDFYRRNEGDVYSRCDKCLGNGKIDWIEKATGCKL